MLVSRGTTACDIGISVNSIKHPHFVGRLPSVSPQLAGRGVLVGPAKCEHSAVVDNSRPELKFVTRIRHAVPRRVAASRHHSWHQLPVSGLLMAFRFVNREKTKAP